MIVNIEGVDWKMSEIDELEADDNRSVTNPGVRDRVMDGRSIRGSIMHSPKDKYYNNNNPRASEPSLLSSINYGHLQSSIYMKSQKFPNNA
jgi:hypothetical protein